MGAVYRAYDPKLRRRVAIKVLSRHLLADSQFRARFDREARVVAGLQHHAIVPVYEYGEEDGEPYLVFQYMEGGSLADKIAQEGQLPLEVVAAVTQRVADALDYAHGKGVIHRDVKPANIVFDASGNAWLGDFGIAALAAQTVTLTGLGTIGSPAYMSPEQCEGKPATAASDIYSLGCTVFEALTGRPPFQAESPMALLLKHIREEPPLVSALRDGVAREMDRSMGVALAKDPSIRHTVAQPLASAFETRAPATDPVVLPVNLEARPTSESAAEPLRGIETVTVVRPASPPRQATTRLVPEPAAPLAAFSAPEDTGQSKLSPRKAYPAYVERRFGWRHRTLIAWSVGLGAAALLVALALLQ